MKADYAAEAKCKGWRRMTFIDEGPGIDGNPGKKLASYELQKASARGRGWRSLRRTDVVVTSRSDLRVRTVQSE